ncbi:MATE family efflux transporter [Jeotgalibaca sp. MA1X17-3]|uniref:MATE family efflux transporter n=1 Tax=Jeotgalibaca sp. MA1X17-3 TaxID=2908211 RepID=UPI0037BE6538
MPIILSSLVNTLYNLVDTFWLGKIGPNELAAITIVTPLQQITTSFGAMLLPRSCCMSFIY